MKTFTYLFAVCALVMILATGCKKKDDGGPIVEEEQLAALNGTWSATSVADDAGERTDYLEPLPFQIIINGQAKTYTTANGPDRLPFPPSGSFSLDPENVLSTIIIDGTYTMYYSISTDGVLTLTIQNYQGEGYSNVRAESVVGNWTFKFSK